MDLIDKFYDEWFNNPDWWFSKKYKYDEYISHTYSSLLEQQYLHNTNPLKIILVYDQLPRHVYRNEYASHIIQYYLEKALNIVNNYIYTPYYHTLTAVEWTFFMLPLRHTKNNKYIFQVLKETWKRIETDQYNSHIYKRYLKATYNKLLSDNVNQINLIESIFPSISKITYDEYKSILYFSPERYVSQSNDITSNCIPFNYHIIDKTKPIIISLSGGVDSMVCSIFIKKYFKESDIIALHICYDNRDECDKEVIFLKHWCSHLNIPLFIRKICEIHRNKCMQYELRDLYESYTRDVRYNCYKSIANHELPQVVMGHNSDDMVENIMTNIAHKNKYDNLYGMMPASIQDSINFLRPLLNTSKEDIIKFAHDNNIPYLPNSTPTWSQRGQIRNNVIPVLDKWDQNFVASLFNLSYTMTSLYKIMETSVNQFTQKGVFNKTNDVFTIDAVHINELIEEHVYWKEVFKKIYNIHPSTKSIENFIFNLQKYKSSFHEIGCKQKKKIMITKNTVFEIEKKDQSKYIKVIIYFTM